MKMSDFKQRFSSNVQQAEYWNSQMSKSSSTDGALNNGADMSLIALLNAAPNAGAEQASTITGLVDSSTGPLGDLGVLRNIPAPSFADRFATVPDFLPRGAFAEIRSQAEGLAAADRSLIPTHKKGGTVAYQTIIRDAPALVALYRGEALNSFISRIVGEPVHLTPLHDQSSLSVLAYERPGDHIGWHYDHNFYRGRHFTLLLPVVNFGSAPCGHSHAKLIAKLNGAEIEVASPPNKLVVFEGARVLHRVTPVQANERRLVVSMTYCADPQISTLGEAARRVKDTAFFGIKALWS
jgi:hypothetical protein